VVEWLIAHAPSAGAASWGEAGITVGDFEVRQCVVTDYQVTQNRQFQEDGNVVTRMELSLNIRQNQGPQDRRTTLAFITFGAHAPEDTSKIGRIARRPPSSNPGEFELDVTLPPAEFDHYWNILTDKGQTHLSCTIEPHEGHDITQFALGTRTHIDSAS
jgi:hypothetical protein